jgi:hypothetical protein
MTLQVQIKRPPNYTGGDEWTELQAERIDFDLNNDVKAVAITKDENKVIDVTAATTQLLITGVLSGDTATADMWNLIVYAREWKFAEIDQNVISSNAKVKWRDREEYMMINRLTFIESAETDANALEYLLTLAIRMTPRT